jgi:Tfp pilus assembly protein PilV
VPHAAKKQQPWHPRGFTFVEVLATLTFVAIVLPPVMNGISLSLTTALVAKQQAQASVLGQSKLMELVDQGGWESGGLAGDFGADWPGYRWTAQVSDWDGTTLRQVDVTVAWKQANKDRSVAFSTLVYTGTSGGQTP